MSKIKEDLIQKQEECADLLDEIRILERDLDFLYHQRDSLTKQIDEAEAVLVERETELAERMNSYV